MKNWNTDMSKFKTSEEKKIWEIVQKIEYGLDGKPLSKEDVLQYWDTIQDSISRENKRLLEFLLWGKQYSLPTSDSFWTK